MSALRPGQDRIRDYLLRRMSEEERAAFESAYFSDDRLLDRVEEEEDGLVSDYVLGRLPESDRHRFEESLLGSPYYRERVETTSRLRQRIAQHRAFDRRGKGARPSRPLPNRRTQETGRQEPGRLFPGRTGSVIAFALLSLLLVAAVLSALTLRTELERARAAPARPATPAPAGLTRSPSAVIPTTQSVVLLPSEVPGPALRRVLRAPGAPLLLVIPSRLLPPGARAVSVVVGDSAENVWRSGRIARDPFPDGPDLAVRLPPGIPADGRSAVTVVSEGSAGRQELSLGILEIAPAPR